MGPKFEGKKNEKVEVGTKQYITVQYVNKTSEVVKNALKTIYRAQSPSEVVVLANTSGAHPPSSPVQCRLVEVAGQPSTATIKMP